MAKRIVICSDGTGNTSIKGRGTNVFKLFEAVDLTSHRFDPSVTPQVALYDDGVGTESFKPLKIFAGATGFGLSRNVRQLYKELVRIYDPDNEIYVFGFSRGAFTVRTLVGLIGRCGLVDPAKLRPQTAKQLDSVVKKAYRAYRSCFRTKLAEVFRGKPNDELSVAFKQTYSRENDVRIRFIGIWDTVDAVGLPFHLGDILNKTFYRFKFPDYRLSRIVDRACHALAIDDERHSFRPLMWDETREEDGRIEQVWFAGAHSNVGGGYPKQGMSLVALDWMLAQAERGGLRCNAKGLRFNPDERRGYSEHANVDDKLYDPRAGLGIFYRWKPRDVDKLCRVNGVKPKLHMSVLERIAHGTEDYAPGNLPPATKVVFTEPTNPSHRELLERRAMNLERELAAWKAAHAALPGRVRDAFIVGRLSYYVYLLSFTAVVIAAAGGTTATALLDPVTMLTNIGTLIGGVLTSPFLTAFEVLKKLLATPQLLAGLVGGFALAYFMSLYADERRSNVFSEFWYGRQQTLRDALKQARQDAQESTPGPQPIPHGGAVRSTQVSTIQ
jgi:uncharacterized protein (DUF2235 family)